jgi:hypothetical protein
MKYIIDIDNTICKEEGPVINRKPWTDRVEKINQLYDDGHIIIFYTARGNKSGRGEEYYGPITKAQLSAWGVKYHELYFKPFDGDIFIDDRSVHPDEFFK